MIQMISFGSMSPKTTAFLFLMCVQILFVSSATDNQDVTGLNSLKTLWKNVPPTWGGYDPCGKNWEGIVCNSSRVISITLSSIGLKGQLSGDISSLSELQTLDLSYNKGLTGPLPSTIGNLAKLTNLILVGCSFSGVIPDTIGSLKQLVFLSLNSNSFIGKIPHSIGNLANLYWLDLADNALTGTIPVSNGSGTPGLDLLVHTKHFHLGKNKLSGTIPPQLLNENMTLIHLLLDNNQLTGGIPATLCLVKALEVVRLDRNSLSGPVPSNLNNLTNVNELLLSNNQLTGPMPNLTSMNLLAYLDVSNNSFEASDFPSWLSALPSLTTLMMERTFVQGMIPSSVFGLLQLQTVILKNNRISGTLDLGTGFSSQLQLVDMQNNNVSGFVEKPELSEVQIILIGNPSCEGTASPLRYCSLPQHSGPSYSTPPNNCAPLPCSSGQVSSPNCKCAYPYTGTLVFRAPSFSDLGNSRYYEALERNLTSFFKFHRAPLDSVSLSNISKDADSYLQMTLDVFPFRQDQFNRTGISVIGFMLSNQTFKPPKIYGPFYFIATDYTLFADEPSKGHSRLSTVVIVGIAVGGSALLILLLCAGAFILCLRRRSTRTKTVEPASPYDMSWIPSRSSSSVLQLTGAKCFRLDELKRCTNNFSEANDIGSGGYGKVYHGSLASGQLVAVKRAQKGSLQGGLEFKTEIELLSRVHHKNLVSLLGFCFESNEQILIYEYVPNGTLKESLSGKSGIRLDWRRRIKVALGAARGVAYLHELANPPIIHRDIKSNNILLDDNLNAKVSDFGLSKPLSDTAKGHVTTQVKGTMGYLDPEYYMTQKLTEKSDVYSFGVLMMEIITGRPPIERGRYIVREVKNAMDRTQDLYSLHELLDPGIGLGTTLGGFEKFVDLALRCVEEVGVERPAMGEVVKVLETILEMAGLNPYSDSASTSAAFGSSNSRNPYVNESLMSLSGALPR